ncbi:MAG TPA: cupin domain-containing protein [Fimbriimonas sp.]
MENPFKYVASLSSEIEIPKDGITSRALYNDAATRVVIFGFDQGQELSEHTASMPAIVHILSGEATLTLGDQPQEASAGSWAYMEANLSHSIVAKTPVIMLLTMMKAAKGS